MYDLIRGPLVWIAFVVFGVGLVYQVIQFFRLTRKKETLYVTAASPPKDSEKRKGRIDRIHEAIRYLKKTVWYSHSSVMIVSAIFHFFLVVTPFFVLGHSVLLDRSLGFSIGSLSESMTDGFTLIVLFSAAFFFARRIAVARVRAITTAYDYLTLLIAVAPFLTGYLAYHQWFDYGTLMFLHILTGEVMLIAIPFTKLGHMLFFFLYRFLIGSEHSLSQANRTW
jgi:nitrate reductase gamma subunit